MVTTGRLYVMCLYTMLWSLVVGCKLVWEII
nr:MAG TPA: hypothetical protein [Caudoviricetes sp.]